ncbi:MAG: twin-arginine translocase subunit TatC [Rikenellaceae bacterium]
MSKKVFWDHIDDLRYVIMRVFVVWIVLTVTYFLLMPYIFNEVILAPTRNDFIFYELLRSIGEKFSLEGDFFVEEFNVKLINISLAAPFFIHISTSIITSTGDPFTLAVVALPLYILYEVSLFMVKRKEVS